jgi:hypothetical protein
MRKLVAQSIRSTVDHLMLGLAHVQHALAVKTTTLTTQSGGGPDEALQSRRAPTRAYSRCPSRQNDKGFSHRCFVALIAWIWARGGPSSPSNFKLRQYRLLSRRTRPFRSHARGIDRRLLAGTSSRTARARIGVLLRPSRLRLRRPLAKAINDKLWNDEAEAHRHNDSTGGQAVGDGRAQEFEGRLRAVGKL